MNKIAAILLSFGGIVLLIAVIFHFTIDFISPLDLTATRMHVIKRRILLFAHTHNRLPHDLNELSPISGYDNSLCDAWNRKLSYIVSESGNIRLQSFGKDGISGGKGDNTDIVRIFSSKDELGKWSDEFVPWEEEPGKTPNKAEEHNLP